jgi:hypothetical protein
MRAFCLSMAVVAAVCGCSKKPMVEECFDEFVQDFEITIPGWVTRVVVCKESAKQLPSPGAFRNRVSSIHVEYSEADYYLVQTDRFWRAKLGKRGEDDPKYCHDVDPVEQVTTQRFIGGELETRVVIDGEPVAERVTYAYKSNVLFGENHLVDPHWQDHGVTDAKDTDFKLRCAHTVRLVANSTSRTEACMPVEPVKSCTAVRHMLPMAQVGNTDFGILRGATTRLEMGKPGTLVDKSTWSLEPGS